MKLRAAGAVAAVALLFSGCTMDEEVAVAEGIPCRVAQRLVPLPGSATEASGAAVSRAYAEVIWTHNDSGGEPQVIAVDQTGRLLGILTVRGADNLDWEDIEIGPCPGGSCMYIGDIGDNAAEREDIAVYRAPEPGPEDGSIENSTRFTMTYPGGPRDAEGLFVLPPERVFIVTKGDNSAIEVYEYPGPLRSDEQVELRLVRQLSAEQVPLEDRATAASASPDGRYVAIRTRTTLLIYETDSLIGEGDTPPMNVDLTSLGEPQGEGIGFAADGVLVTTSEGGVEAAPGMMGILWCPLE